MKQVNGMQSRIKGITRQMMAKVSELSMHQANALRLQQEISDRRPTLLHVDVAHFQCLLAISDFLLQSQRVRLVHR